MSKVGRPKKIVSVVKVDTTDYKKACEELHEDNKLLRIRLAEQSRETQKSEHQNQILRLENTGLKSQLDKNNSVLSQCFTREYLYKEFINTLLEKLKGN